MNVFLSYAQKDRKWAQAIKSGLANSGVEIIDPADNIFPGENWHLESGKALERSEAMIVLLSPEALASPSVQSEIAYALSSPHFRDRLFPVLVRPTARVPWILRKRPFIRHSRNVADTVDEIAAALSQGRAAAIS